MPNHTRDSEENDGGCAVRWCTGTALDSEYCWKHTQKYGTENELEFEDY